MTAANPSLRRLSYPLRPGPFSEPSDLYLLPLSAISTSGTGSAMSRTPHRRVILDMDSSESPVHKPRPDLESESRRGRKQVDKARVDVERIKKAWSSFCRRPYRFTRCRLSRLFFFVTACCGVVTALIWYFALFDDPQARIFMSLFIVLIPMFEFQPPPRTWASREGLLWSSSFAALTVLSVAGVKFDWAGVALNSFILLGALSYGVLVWKLMRGNRLLQTGLILALVVVMIFWTVALVRDEESLDVLLLPLPFVLFFGVAWAPVAWWILDTAGRWKNRESAALVCVHWLWPSCSSRLS